MAERGGGTLAEDGYEAFNAIATEDTTALTKSTVKYAEQSGRVDAQANGLGACMEAMTMQPQPLGLGLLTQVANFANNTMYQPAVGLPLGFNDHQDYGFYPPHEATTCRHPGPFGNPQECAQYAKSSSQSSFESTKRRRLGNV